MVAIKTKIKKIYKVKHLINLCNKALDEAQHLIQKGLFSEALQIVCVATSKLLSQNSLSLEEKEEFQRTVLDHPVKHYFHQDPFTNHSYQKPMSYSGDATLLDYIYRIKGTNAKTSFMGKEIFSTTIEASPCVSVRWRAKHLAEKIDDIADKSEQPVNVLSIASGHLREINYIQNFESKIGKFDALDQDVKSNALVRSIYNYNNLNVLDESILYVLDDQLPNNHYDFIYSAGLFDYLQDKIAKQMISKIYSALKPNGKMLVVNFAPGMLEQGYMETFMD